MYQARTNDLDYLAARLHGRRSRLAEADRLDELCRLSRIAELADRLCPGKGIERVPLLQRRWVGDLVAELSGLRDSLSGAGERLLNWMLVRFQVENLKVLFRGFAAQAAQEPVKQHLFPLPKELALNVEALTGDGSLAELVKRLPDGPLQRSVKELVGGASEPPRPFFLEAALDRGYFRELLARAERIPGTDREAVQALVRQEVDTFHLMLALRGRFHYGLTPESLERFHAGKTGISPARFVGMLNAPDPVTAAKWALGRVFDRLPQELRETVGRPVIDVAAALEAVAWNRYLQLANRAFRRSHLGLGAVIGYAGIRRMEVANLITLVEGIRAGLPAEVIRGRLFPRREVEVVHV